MQKSLWGDDFKIPSKNDKDKVINKINNPKKVKTISSKLSSSSLSITEKLELIYKSVNNILGKFKKQTNIITTKEDLIKYIDKAISNGVIAIDTETNNSLDPLTCKLIGACVYTPGELNAYIPTNHIHPVTRQRIETQLTEEDILLQFSRLKNTKIIMHNAKFDYQVLKCTCGLDLQIYWDTQVASKVLNENEPAKLKYQYTNKIDNSMEAYSINQLFENIEYAVVDMNIFALYAATDAFMTYELYRYQETIFKLDENKKLYNLFTEIEMPITKVVSDMELTGVLIDVPYANRLSDKYHKKLADLDSQINQLLSTYTNIVSEWRTSKDANIKPRSSNGNLGKSKNEQLKTPINLESPTQLSILLYDILNIPPPNKKKLRSVGEKELTKIDLPLCKLILKRRGLLKLINTYIDKLPACVSETDNRIHASFNQYGADTGRFSSSNPNLQNIPSKNKEIRMIFKATEGYKLIGADYSAQEPRLLAAYAKDQEMIDTFEQGRDLYSQVASIVYKNNYEDNREFYPDGTPNAEGKKRRGNCKSIILGIMYGRGIASIAEQIKTHDGKVTRQDIQDAEKIINTFFTSFPLSKKWMEDSLLNAQAFGYVEDLWGRRRRLPEIQLQKYEVLNKNQHSSFNPLLGTSGENVFENTNLISSYYNLLNNARNKKEIDNIISQAKQKNILIKNNSGKIAQAERQAVNARIQGGAASMSKKAMIAIHNDEVMKYLGFRLLIAVHDELIGEAPIKNAEKAAERLSELMIEAAKPECVIPMKCDTTLENSWYESEYKEVIKNTVAKLKKEPWTQEHIVSKLLEEHSELTLEKIYDII